MIARGLHASRRRSRSHGRESNLVPGVAHVTRHRQRLLPLVIAAGRARSFPKLSERAGNLAVILGDDRFPLSLALRRQSPNYAAQYFAQSLETSVLLACRHASRVEDLNVRFRAGSNPKDSGALYE